MSKQSMLVHGTWCLIVSLAFASGYQRGRTASVQASDSTGVRSTPPLMVDPDVVPTGSTKRQQLIAIGFQAQK